MHRSRTTRPRLLRYSTAAAAITVGFLGGMLTTALVPESNKWHAELVDVFIWMAYGGFAIYYLSYQVSRTSPKLIWGWVAETGDDCELTLSLPEASCPECGALMIVLRFFPEAGYLDAWVCTSGEKEHRLPFDLPEFIAYAE